MAENETLEEFIESIKNLGLPPEKITELIIKKLDDKSKNELKIKLKELDDKSKKELKELDDKSKKELKDLDDKFKLAKENLKYAKEKVLFF